MTPSAAGPAASTYLNVAESVALEYLALKRSVGVLYHYRLRRLDRPVDDRSAPDAFTFVTSAVRSVAALSYTSLAMICMPWSGASFSIAPCPLADPVLLESTPTFESFIFFICSNI